jgi:hypothetical protein
LGHTKPATDWKLECGHEDIGPRPIDLKIEVGTCAAGGAEMIWLAT